MSINVPIVSSDDGTQYSIATESNHTAYLELVDLILCSYWIPTRICILTGSIEVATVAVLST